MKIKFTGKIQAFGHKFLSYSHPQSDPLQDN
ncbi:hypothetical protein N476_20040 [Pseudoalteromonas luteoviolacea H33]|uniref:Uncharacterized protein n=1 Tax=Pseudoalteromonas luteoviolacea H33 TaxID=1365251 RepID=A0A161Y372_9GAMM|nr:hypothetical protein N476_20040 [Pseudoalteromonas luteoviolacea H33]KZN74853.1 hypothetical protein N477_20745 [Pseudoalteromonas luteoviolacea H33-S]